MLDCPTWRFRQQPPRRAADLIMKLEHHRCRLCSAPVAVPELYVRQCEFMSRYLRVVRASALAAILVCGCVSTSRSPASAPQPADKTTVPRLTEIGAIRIAVRTLEKEGRDFSRYRDPEVTRDGATWQVFFRGKLGIFGDHFMVLVDDRTGQAQI